MQCVKQLKRASYTGKSKRMCQFDDVLLMRILQFVCICLVLFQDCHAVDGMIFIQHNLTTYILLIGIVKIL